MRNLKPPLITTSARKSPDSSMRYGTCSNSKPRNVLREILAADSVVDNLLRQLKRIVKKRKRG